MVLCVHAHAQVTEVFCVGGGMLLAGVNMMELSVTFSQCLWVQQWGLVSIGMAHGWSAALLANTPPHMESQLAQHATQDAIPLQ